MIDIKILRENPKLVKENIKKKFQEDKLELVDKVLDLDLKWRKEKKKVDDLRSSRNKISASINELMKKGSKGEASKLISEAKKIPAKISKVEAKTSKYLKEIREIMIRIPNMMHESVPSGGEEKDNVELRKWGEIPKFDFKIKNHVDLVEDLFLVDSKKGSLVAGSRFYYLRGDLVLLNLALQRFALDVVMKKNFLPIQPPYMLNKQSMGGAVSLADFEENIYKIENEDLFLIGTSEHSLAAMHQNENLNLKNPLKYAGLSSCFRKEAGSHGKDTKGIFRVHRFEKIEQFVFCAERDEQAVFDEIISNQEEIFKLLKIPYRVLALCGGEVGGTMARTYDLEGWFPSQKKYRELGSTSSATTYQSRKLNIRYQEKGKLFHSYTVNGTAMSVQRTMCCLLENYQEKDGSIKIPKILQPYMGGAKKIGIKK
ncbi:MAG: serine--tRNA ligase [Nanoarchaeota archaeon]|nr:serine--tRNA ligase [Nanoarchaeota archaeon]